MEYDVKVESLILFFIHKALPGPTSVRIPAAYYRTQLLFLLKRITEK